MKFFTKEWYNTMYKSGMGCLLEVDSKAESFSEVYYRKIYRELKEKWLTDRKDICEYLQEPFEQAKESRAFDMWCRASKKEYITNTPKEILAEVADIRLLALNRCSQSVKTSMEAFSQKCKMYTEQAFSEYRKYVEKQFKNDFPNFFEGFQFHDDSVLSFRKCGKDNILIFEREETENWSIRKIVFRNASIVRMEKRLAGAWWLYEEVHKTTDGYEIHILLDKNGLFDFIIKCDDVILCK